MKNQDCFIYSLDQIGDYLSIPRLLVTHEVYGNLSSEAKIIYSLFLERMQETVLLDQENHRYIIFPEYEIQALVNLSGEELTLALEELEHGKIALIQRVKQDYDLPTHIYLRNYQKIEKATEKEKAKTPPTIQEFHAKVREEEGKKQGKILYLTNVGV